MPTRPERPPCYSPGCSEQRERSPGKEHENLLQPCKGDTMNVLSIEAADHFRTPEGVKDNSPGVSSRTRTPPGVKNPKEHPSLSGSAGRLSRHSPALYGTTAEAKRVYRGSSIPARPWSKPKSALRVADLCRCCCVARRAKIQRIFSLLAPCSSAKSLATRPFPIYEMGSKKPTPPISSSCYPP